MLKKEFEKLINDSVGALPKSIREKINNVEIVLEEGESKNNSLFGLYHGLPQTKRSSNYSGVLPDKITIWKGTIEKFAGSEENISKLVKRVVWHEIGHYFGFDEASIRKLERKWKKEKRV